MIKRRDFLKLCLASGLGRFNLGFVNEDFGSFEPFSIIQLKGGNDALNTVVPFTLDTYFKSRRTLALDSNSLLPLNHTYALNPALGNLHARFKQGHVAVFVGVGYPDVSFSHERAEQIWHSGHPGQLSDKFWLDAHPHEKLQPISVCDFDTHHDQAEQHCEALLKLDKKIGQLSKSQLCFAYSEMGRSLLENADGGTDHGHCNVAFLIGEKLRGGVFGEYVFNEEVPTKKQFAIDFREIYYSIKRDHLV